MNRLCRIIRRQAAEAGVDALREEGAVREHLAACAGCRRAFAALLNVDDALAALPRVDAPDDTVAALLDRVAAEQRGALAAPRNGESARAGRLADLWQRLRLDRPPVRRMVALAAVAVVALAAAFMLERGQRLEEPVAQPGGKQKVFSPPLRPGAGGEVAQDTASQDGADGMRRNGVGSVGGEGPQAPAESGELRAQHDQQLREIQERLERLRRAAPRPPASPPPPPLRLAPPPPLAKSKKVPIPDLTADLPSGRLYISGQLTEAEERARTQQPLAEEKQHREGLLESVDDVVFGIPDAPAASEKRRLGALQKNEPAPAAEAEPASRRDAVPTAREPQTLVTETPGVLADREEADGEDTKGDAVFIAPGTADQDGAFAVDGVNITDLPAVGASPTAHDFDQLEAMNRSVPTEEPASPAPARGARKASDADHTALAVAQAFLAERERITGVLFQDATGYWANTYVPGDPELRRLEARLAGQGADAPDLHRGARPPAQPFDPPRSAAMALYVDADRAAATGPGRTLVQVGLRATDRRGGGRPSLSVAVVLDLGHDLGSEAVASLRALLAALAAAAEPGDRFRVFFAGREVEPVAPAAFRHGALMVALDDALAAPRSGGRHAVRGAVAEADQALLAAEVDAPLGATGVLLVSSRPQPEPGLEAAVQRSALAGVAVSVAAVGADASRAAYRGLALAGQGRIRFLAASEEAEELIDRELASVSRVVARALRLNVRLAPGVMLVGVLGSHRLGADAAARERAAEQRIDAAVARQLGIKADRGDDDDGIQILIPAFLAGDSHVVLLDVVVPGPGRVADVSLRYKDLVRSKNAVARARLTLDRSVSGRRAAAAARRAHSVRRSLLAHTLRTELTAAALPDPAAAQARIGQVEALLAGLSALDPVWAADPDLAADLALVRAFRRLLAETRDGAVTDRALADSLRLAGARKLMRIAPVDGR